MGYKCYVRNVYLLKGILRIVPKGHEVALIIFKNI